MRSPAEHSGSSLLQVIRSRYLYLVVAVLGVAAPIHMTGCSIVGLIGGTAIDANSPRWEMVPTGGVARLQPADSLVLYLRDSTVVRGIYVGPSRLPDDVYAERFEAWRTSLPAGVDLPGLGHHIEVQIIKPVEYTSQGDLVAFSSGGIEIQDPPGEPKLWRYDQIHQVLIAGSGSISGERLLQLRLAGQLPLVTSVTVEMIEGTRDVPLDDVRLVRVPTERHSARNGFIIGLALDAMVVAIAASEFSASASDGCYSSGSTYSLQLQEHARIRALAEAYERELRTADRDMAHSYVAQMEVAR